MNPVKIFTWAFGALKSNPGQNHHHARTMFSIITPTYKRPTELARAVASVLGQSVSDWEMIIINDNPGDDATSGVTALGDPRIKVFQNEKNEGVNFCRNRGLDAISPLSARVIFLDDDDYLAPEALRTLEESLATQSVPWLVSPRGTTLTTPTAHFKRGAGKYNYATDCLLGRSLIGDVTHCIDTRFVNGNTAKIRFSSAVKQAEEWVFYLELSRYTCITAIQTVTTLTNGYSQDGLNFRQRVPKEERRNLKFLGKENLTRTSKYSLIFWLYLTARYIKTLVR
jgi:glycosyltransferase involved in cell wall biosynthesis